MMQNRIFDKQTNDAKWNISQTNRLFKIEYLTDKQINQGRIFDRQTNNVKSNI